jgi:hypothetical protein
MGYEEYIPIAREFGKDIPFTRYDGELSKVRRGSGHRVYDTYRTFTDNMRNRENEGEA